MLQLPCPHPQQLRRQGRACIPQWTSYVCWFAVQVCGPIQVSVDVCVCVCVSLYVCVCLSGALATPLSSLTLTLTLTVSPPFSAAILFAWSITSAHPFPFDYHLLFLIVAVGSVGAALVTLPEEKPDDGTSTSINADTSSGIGSGTSASPSDGKRDEGEYAGMEMAPPRSSYKHMPSAGPTRFMKLSSEDEGADVEFGLQCDSIGD